MNGKFDRVLVDDSDRVLRGIGSIKNGVKGGLVSIGSIKFNRLLDFIGSFEEFQIKLDILGFSGVQTNLDAVQGRIEWIGLDHKVTLNQVRCGRGNQVVGSVVVGASFSLIDGRVDGQFHFSSVQDLDRVDSETLGFDDNVQGELFAVHQVSLDHHGGVIRTMPEVDFGSGGSTIGLEQHMDLLGLRVDLKGVHRSSLNANGAIHIGFVANHQVQGRRGLGGGQRCHKGVAKREASGDQKTGQGDLHLFVDYSDIYLRLPQGDFFDWNVN
mmetsp:Transcript_9985/g.20657  ORF Transcript_9985/g.20657 Transcript_9985/m.20657 type:complete len:270 (+) Transcript_9985:322-1131(+)